MPVQLRGKGFATYKSGATDMVVPIPPATQVGDLLMAHAVAPPGQPDDPVSIDGDYELLSVGGDVDPADSPMLIHSFMAWKNCEQSDLDDGFITMHAPADNPVAYGAVHVFYGHNALDPIDVSTGLPICEAGTNPCAGQNGNRTNPDCPCPTFYTDDVTVTDGGSLAFLLAFSHKQAWPMQPPAGYEVLDFPVIERDLPGADIALLIATQTVPDGPLTGPEIIPDGPDWEHAGVRLVVIRPAVVSDVDEPDRWYIGDPNEGLEPGTAVVEFETTGTTGFLIEDWPRSADIGDDDLTLHKITEQGFDDTQFGGRTRGTKKASLTGFIRGSDFADLRDRNRQARRWMDGERVLVYIPFGGADPTYFDVLPGSVQPIIGGQDRARNRALRHHQAEALVTFERQAYSRRPRLNSYVAGKASNQYNEGWIVVDNPGTAESPMRWVITPPLGQSLVRVWWGRISHGNLTERIKSERGIADWDMERVDAVLGDDASSSASSKASSSLEALLTFGDAPYDWQTVSTFTITTDDPTALAGIGLFFAVARQEEGQLVDYRLAWGTALGLEPPFIDPPYYRVDSTNMTQSKYRLIPLGEVAADAFGNALVERVQVKAVDGRSEDLVVGVDQAKILPADEQVITVAERSFLSLDGTEVFYASQDGVVTHGVQPSDDGEGALVEAPLNVLGTERILGTGAMVGATNKTDEGWSFLPPEGITLPVGLHRFVAELDVFQADASAGIEGQVVLRRSTNDGATWTSAASFSLRSVKGFQTTTYDRSTDEKAIVSVEVTDDTDLWTGYVVFTAAREPMDDDATATRYISVRDVYHVFVDCIEHPNSLVVDGFALEAYVMDPNGARIRPLEADGFPTAMPDVNAYFLIFETKPVVGMAAGLNESAWGLIESDQRYSYIVALGPRDHD